MLRMSHTTYQSFKPSERLSATLHSALFTALLLASSIASSQSITNLVFFGDSNTDSGRYSLLPQYTTGPSANSLNATGVLTSAGGLMWSQHLGLRFDVAVRPNGPGGEGNNYAASNARVSLAGNNLIGENAWSAEQQIGAYLASRGGQAQPDTLYTLYIGTNDLKPWTAGGLGNIVDPRKIADVNTLATQTIALVGRLGDAGARFILVPNLTPAPLTSEAAQAAGFTAWTTEWASSVAQYNRTVWNGLATQGRQFVPADFASVGNYVLLNPRDFGITETSILRPACRVYAGDCTAADLVTPDAGQTHFFADTTGHVAAAVQRIQADYAYGLLVAPGRVSLLATQALLGRIAEHDVWLDQIGANFRQHAPGTLGAWTQGAVQRQAQGDVYNDNRSSRNGTSLGMDLQLSPRLLLGIFAAQSMARSRWADGSNFSQQAQSAGAYAVMRQEKGWLRAVLAHGELDNQLGRVTPIGIQSFSNASRVSGGVRSAVMQAGLDLDHGSLRHGPVIGYARSRADIDGFTESGNFNSLKFSAQRASADVLSAGYQLHLLKASWAPFVQAAHHRVLSDKDRDVEARLTTADAPPWRLPALSYGRSWSNLSLGLNHALAPTLSLRARLAWQFAPERATARQLTLSLYGVF